VLPGGWDGAIAAAVIAVMLETIWDGPS
jgi:hypothetical protein